MQLKLAKQWHNALISGQYKKCKGRLRKKDSNKKAGTFTYRYDIFGVLMQITGQPFQDNIQHERTKISQQYKGQLALYGYDFPPLDFLKKVGLSNGEAAVLVGLSDSDLSFEELADIVLRLGA